MKELESLSFDIASNDVLKNLFEEVQALKAKYQQNATRESGLILRTQVQATSSCERVRKLKLKYKYFRQHTAPYGSLKPKNTPGRPDLEVTTITETELERKHLTGERYTMTSSNS